jgi:hypothetical protein
MEPLHIMLYGGGTIAVLLMVYMILTVTKNRTEINDIDDDYTVDLDEEDSSIFSDEDDDELLDLDDDEFKANTEQDSIDENIEDETDNSVFGEEESDATDEDVLEDEHDDRESLKAAIKSLDPTSDHDWAYFGQSRQRPSMQALEEKLGYHPDFQLMLEVWNEINNEKK